MTSYQFKVQGLTCGACVKIIKKRVEKIAGIIQVEVNIQGQLQIKEERDLDKSEIIAALKDTDYKIL